VEFEEDCVDDDDEQSNEQSDDEQHEEVDVEAPPSLAQILEPLETATAKSDISEPMATSAEVQDQGTQVDVNPQRTLIALKIENIALKRELELERGRIPMKDRAEEKFRCVT
jgi:hypothetical protein